MSYHDITLITGGSSTFGIDDKQYNISEGDILFTAPQQIRQWNKNNIPDGYALIFDEDFILSFFNDTGFIKKLSFFNSVQSAKKLTLNSEQYQTVLNLILNIQKEIKDLQNTHLLRALLYQVLSLLDALYRNENAVGNIKNGNNSYINKFTALIDENYKNGHTTAFYAGILCITPNYLNSIVKKYTGQSAKQLIQNRRLLEAKRLLAYSSLSITEIAHKLNFESVSYFIRFFRKITSTTPLEYRNSENR